MRLREDSRRERGQQVTFSFPRPFAGGHGTEPQKPREGDSSLLILEKEVRRGIEQPINLPTPGAGTLVKSCTSQNTKTPGGGAQTAVYPEEHVQRIVNLKGGTFFSSRNVKGQKRGPHSNGKKRKRGCKESEEGEGSTKEDSKRDHPSSKGFSGYIRTGKKKERLADSFRLYPV